MWLSFRALTSCRQYSASMLCHYRPAIGNPFATASAVCNVSGAATSLCVTLRITPGTSSAKTRTDGALIHYIRVGHRSPPPRDNERHERCEPWIASFAPMQSIRQSVQNGQFLSRLAQNASDLSVASHTDKRIERFLVYVVATALAIDQTSTLQLIEPAYDRGAGHAHIGSDLGDRERLAVDVAKGHA